MSQPSQIRTLLLPPPGTGFNYGANSAPAVIAPDQKRLVFGTRDADGATRLWIQDLDASEPYPVPGTEGALFPFWSPDGRFLAFFARGTLKVTEASRSPGPARTLAADIVEARGGTWGDDGTILYSPGNAGVIMRVSATGGKPEPATHLEGEERSHRWPRFLPGSRRFLYEVRKPGQGAGAAALASRLTYLASLDGKEKRLVLSEVTSAAYVPPGYLLFGRTNNLMAVACDPKTLELEGEPVVLQSDIEGFTAPGAPFFSASERLLVLSQHAGARMTRMVWYDRSGKELSTVGSPGEYLSLGMAPDGRTAVAARAEEPLPPDLWLFDTGVGRGIRLTRDNVPQLSPVVAPGGQRIFFSSYARGPWNIWSTTPQGGKDLKPFLESETTKAAKDVSPDGRFLLYREFNVGTLGDLKFAALEGDPAPKTFVGTADDETNGDFSPDGRWVAYVSDESGRQEVYVASFPEAARRQRVTSEGGTQPRWSRDGKEIFYIRAGHLVAVPVTGARGDALAFGQGRDPLRPPPLRLRRHGLRRVDALRRGSRRADPRARPDPRGGRGASRRHPELGRGGEEDAMTLASGTRLGPYEILSPIGAGGMGEVYRGAGPAAQPRRSSAVSPPSPRGIHYTSILEPWRKSGHHHDQGPARQASPPAQGEGPAAAPELEQPPHHTSRGRHDASEAQSGDTARARDEAARAGQRTVDGR